MILNIIGFIIIFFIMIVLVKRGKFRTTVKLGYFYKHFGNKLSISYKKFTGLEYYNFVFTASIQSKSKVPALKEDAA